MIAALLYLYSVGTGKTLIGVKIAYWFVKMNKQSQTKKQVLFCGPSNSSVDVAAGKTVNTLFINFIYLFKNFAERTSYDKYNVFTSCVYQLCVQNVDELKQCLLVVWYGMEHIIDSAVIMSDSFHKVV